MSNNILADLQPHAVFKYFEQICAIPHGSGNVKQISDYLCEFARERNLWFKQDESYNVIIKKPASNSESKAAPVILQGHIDMVAVKTNDKVKDMEKDGLDLYIDDGYVKADRTTLGADDGIAVAYALAILDSKDVCHPPIEAVFTVDEEIGMLGAEAINTDCLEGKIMLNIDSEEEGIFLSGCAGGATLKASYPLKKSDMTGTQMSIKINGLTSGHSGTDIICQRANANILMGRILFDVKECVNIVSISGGEKDNSIAPFADAVIMTQEADKVTELLNNTANVLKEEYSVTDPHLTIKVNCEGEGSTLACDDATTQMLINVLNFIPDGVVKMSNDIKGLVQTSLNLGVAELAEKYGMDVVRFGGFLDGINESLKTPNPVDTIVAESEVTVDIDLEKLYYNMVAAKADWLYNLPQWDALLTEERRKELYKAQKKSMTVVKGKKIGRNDPCPCGSGKKYKQCCGR